MTHSQHSIHSTASQMVGCLLAPILCIFGLYWFNKRRYVMWGIHLLLIFIILPCVLLNTGKGSDSNSFGILMWLVAIASAVISRLFTPNWSAIEWREEGFRNLHGLGYEPSLEKAIECFRHAAKKGDAESMYMLYIMFRDGRGCMTDINYAMQWCRKAADLGLALAKFEILEFDSDTNRNCAAYVEVCRQAAERGHARAQFILGELYSTGNDILEQDYKKAIEWYTRAAENGQSESIRRIASCQEKLQSVPESSDVLAMCQKLAEMGDNDAQYSLGNRYLKGDGVAQDFAQALKWYRESAKQGNQHALDRLKELGVPWQEM